MEIDLPLNTRGERPSNPKGSLKNNFIPLKRDISASRHLQPLLNREGVEIYSNLSPYPSSVSLLPFSILGLFARDSKNRMLLRRNDIRQCR